MLEADFARYMHTRGNALFRRVDVMYGISSYFLTTVICLQFEESP